MNSKNNIYVLFIIASLIFWNPLSYFLIYDNAQIFSKSQNLYFYIIYSILFSLGIVLIFLIKRNKLKEKYKNIIFSMSFVGIIFSLVVFANLIIGSLSNNEAVSVNSPHNSIFKPNSSAKYHTSEFDFVANINSLGLRDNEINIEKGDKYRILCFGDSWTYGWGVNIDDSWPKILEKYLNNNGYNKIEVINCGRPGMYTTNYKQFMEAYVPLLKPDLVLVGVLQYEDLSQIYTNKFSKREVFSSGELRKIYLGKFIKIFTIYLKRSIENIIPLSETIDISAYWKKTNNNMIDGFHHWQNIRFSTLNDTVQSLFKSGNLEPGLLDLYINFPDRLTIFNNPNHPATKYALEVMINDVAEMRDICYDNNSNLIFVNIPMNYFTGHKVVRNPSDVLNNYYYENNHIDSIYHSVANTNNIPYIEMTDHFINLKNKSNYIFNYDGHPNKNGYYEIGQYIGNQLIIMKQLNKND